MQDGMGRPISKSRWLSLVYLLPYMPELSPAETLMALVDQSIANEG
jgi:hypothetical protein